MPDERDHQSALDGLPPSALHMLECADSTLRHSTGMRALGALKVLAQLAPSRMDKPGFPDKLDAARKGAALARQECEAFFQMRLLQDVRIADIFPAERDTVAERLEALEGLPLSDLPAATDTVLQTLGSITSAIQGARRGLQEFVESETPRLASLCEAAHARLVTRGGSREDRAVFLDPARLSDAVTELVNNALKHAFDGDGGTVRVEVAEGSTPNEMVLVVADDGRGIPAEMQARLFERGVSTGGSGEGLALVREIVETEHLGRLTYMTGSSGTRWEIVLPVKIPRLQLSGRLQGAATVTPAQHPAATVAAGGASGTVFPRVVLAVLAVAAIVGLALGAWASLRGRADRAAVPALGVSEAPGAAESSPRAEPQPTPTAPAAWDSLPGRVPEGFAAVAEAGRHVATGWAREIIHRPSGVVLVFVPAGEFVMGSDGGDTDEAPAHRVRITKPFYLGKFEVTQAEYKKLMGDNPSRFKGDDLPVERVSFVDVAMFLAKAGLRLPTEAEWEYAARGSAPTPGDEQRTSPAGGLPANELGLCGMLGNVAEWCSDWYDLYEPGDAVDPKGPKRGDRRVVRGGSFLSDPAQLRITARSSLDPMEKWDFVGFRAALDVSAVPPAPPAAE